MQILLEITGNKNYQIHLYRMLFKRKRHAIAKMKQNAILNNDARKLADSRVYYFQLNAMLHSYEEIQSGFWFIAAKGTKK